MKITVVQNNPAFGRIEHNVGEVLAELETFSADLIVLPELFATGYQFRDRAEAKSLADPAGQGFTFDNVRKFSRKKNCLMIYGFPEKKDGQLFNSAAAILPDGTFHIYQKTHLFDTEKNIFDPGATGFFVFPYMDTLVGMMICFDWRFPESARTLALLGAQIVCHPSNLVLPHCPGAMIIRALENGVFTVTADRVGTEARFGTPLRFIGHSRLIAPDGNVLAELGGDPGIVTAEIDPRLALNKKVTPQNDLFADRRPEFY